MDTGMQLSTSTLMAVSLALAALALVAVAGVLLALERRRARHGELIERALHRSAAAIAELDAGRSGAPADSGKNNDDGKPAAEPDLPLHWLNTRAGRALVADEDRRLIEKCGFSPLRAQLIFLVVRIATAIGLPLLAFIYWEMFSLKINIVAVLAVTFTFGFLAPKWVLRRRANRRKRMVARELPLFVDLLRLLQGVGLSLDQSLQIMSAEFMRVLPVLGYELTFANRQYAQGRSREHSLQRLATLHDNESLASLVALLVQVDRHGGAVQEPLRAFSERLREQRRSEMKEAIGKITVKMTGIMVLTLLPALIIVTAGPGFLAVIRSLGAM